MDSVGRILIVEPEAVESRRLRSCLRAAGVANTVVTVATGAEALAALRGEGSWVAALINPALADMSGYDLLQELSGGEVAAIIVADSDDEDEVHRAFGAGASGFVERPLRPANALRVLMDGGLRVALVPAEPQ